MCNNISIHAPRTGSDHPDIDVVLASQPDFNPRSPHGERRFTSEPGFSAPYFNPRSPARGATAITHGVLASLRISIHAPPHGERLRGNPYAPLIRKISIHAPPHGERLYCFSHRPCIDAFQSTLPRTGSDGGSAARRASRQQFQSTLPRTGSDRGQAGARPLRNHFNPRSPARGATAEPPARAASRQQFQSTLPRTGSDPITRRNNQWLRISIHAPPHGERRTLYRYLMLAYIISIHAPPHGERPKLSYVFACGSNFNPRSPARGATKTLKTGADPVIFQSTLPRTGSDTKLQGVQPRRTYFNPRSPARGATNSPPMLMTA